MRVNILYHKETWKSSALCLFTLSCRKTVATHGGRLPFLETSTPTPSVDCVQVWPTRVSWSALCTTGNARSHVSILQPLMAPVSSLQGLTVFECHKIKNTFLKKMFFPPTQLISKSGDMGRRDDATSANCGHVWVDNRDHLQQLCGVVDLGFFYHLWL